VTGETEFPEIRVAIYGPGQLGTSVRDILQHRPGINVGEFGGRERRQRVLESGADVVLICTTSFLHDVANDVRAALSAGSNVIVSAEEAAYPWATDAMLAAELDELAKTRAVTIVGGGINPGFAFDWLVLAGASATSRVDRIRVGRIVDLSGFGATVLSRIGVGYLPDEFDSGVAAGTITGHIGFPQSMNVVGRHLGVSIERIDRRIAPIFSQQGYDLRAGRIEAGRSAGFEQLYRAYVDGQVWFEAVFTGHIDPLAIGRPPRDEISIEGDPPLHYVVDPGFKAQSGSASLMANSVRRVVAARPGWITVGELPPALPI